MLLTDVVAENFRAFRHAEITIPPAGLVLFAGENNSGKTALLSAFDVIAGDPGDFTSVRHAGTDALAKVTGTFRLSEEERAGLFVGAPRRDQLLASGAVTRLDFVFAQNEAHIRAGREELGLTDVRGDWPQRGLLTLAGLEATHDGTPGVAFPRALTEDTDVLEPTRRALGGNPPTWLDQMSGYAPGLDYWNQLLGRWRSRFFHFRALRTGTQRSQALASSPKLEPTGGNLAAVLLYLSTDRRALFEQLRALIAEIVPHVGSLEVRTGGGLLRVVFDSASGDLNLKDLGTGVEQLMMTLVVGLMETSPFTLVVEEPETNLHPAGQRALLRQFLTWAEDRQIIAATHSPVMLNWSPGGDRLWLVTRSDDDSIVTKVDADPLPVLNALGVHLADILSADRVLVLEGPSDQDVLGTWFPGVLSSPRVAVLDGEGGDNAVHADQLAEWLAGTDRAGLKRVLYLRDRDELSARTLDRLDKSPTVYLLARRELENYLLDPAAIAAVLGPLVPQGTAPPTPEQVTEVMNQAAESLRRKIVVNRVCRQIGPPQLLVGHKLRQELANAGADEEQVAARVLGRLMTADQLRVQIAEVWAGAEQDVATYHGEHLLEIAPGEEILEAIFQHFAGRKYDKRSHGPVIARQIPPPDEIAEVLDNFMAA